MSCTILTGGITKGCLPNQGGVQKVYITDFENVLSVTESNGTVSAITLASATSYYGFEFNRDTAEMQDNVTINIQNGTNYQAQMVTLIIPRREVAKRNVLKLLLNKTLSIIVEDFNGLYWLMGRTNGMLLSELPSSSGKAAGDLNGYTLTLTGQEPEQAPEVTSGIIAGLIA